MVVPVDSPDRSTYKDIGAYIVLKLQGTVYGDFKKSICKTLGFYVMVEMKRSGRSQIKADSLAEEHL